MTKKSTDRRVPRSRLTLQHALYSLILEKDYETITVREICDAANIGRRHSTPTKSKDDLKRSGFERLRQMLIDRQKEAKAMPVADRNRRFSFSLSMFEHAHDHRD